MCVIILQLINNVKHTIDGNNTFVDVRFDTATGTFLCSFLKQLMLMDRKSCIANVTYGKNCDQHLGTYPATGVGSIMTTPTIEFIPEVSFYCVSISASSGNQTVIVEGNLGFVNIVNVNTGTVIILHYYN